MISSFPVVSGRRSRLNPTYFRPRFLPTLLSTSPRFCFLPPHKTDPRVPIAEPNPRIIVFVDSSVVEAEPAWFVRARTEQMVGWHIAFAADRLCLVAAKARVWRYKARAYSLGFSSFPFSSFLPVLLLLLSLCVPFLSVPQVIRSAFSISILCDSLFKWMALPFHASNPSHLTPSLLLWR